MDARGDGRAHPGQGRAEGAARLRRRRSTRPRTSGCSRSGPGYQEFEDRKWDGAVGGHVGRARARDRAPGRRPARAGGASRARRSCIVGEQDEPFLSAVARDGRRDPRRAARRHPRRGSLAAVREPGRVDHRAHGFLARVARDRALAAVEAHGGRLARRGAAAPRRRRDVHAVGRSPLRALRRRGAGRPAAVDTRHEQTATFAAEGWAKVTRRLGCAALTAGPGVTNGVERDDRGLDERVADGRARRPGAAAAVGCGIAAGARPRPDRRAGHEDAPRPRRRPRRSSPRSTPRAVAARTPHRGPAFVDIPLDAFGPGERRDPRRRRPRSAVTDPDPADVRAVAELVAACRAAGARSRAATSTGPTPRTRSCAVRGGGARSDVRQRHGPRHAPRRPRRSRSRAPGRSR